MPSFQKHLIECRCILPQFTNRNNPPFHKFTVSSVIDNDDNVISKFVQCPNCGIVHKVIDICKSEILRGKEELRTLITIEDIKNSLPKNIAEVLETYDVALHIWEEAQFIVDNRLFDKQIILVSEEVDNSKQGKMLKIMETGFVKIE